MLPALSVNRSLQRLVSEYYDTIDLASDRVPQSDRGPQEAAATAILPPAESSGGVVVGSGNGGVCAVGSDGNGDGDGDGGGVVGNDPNPPRHTVGADSGPTLSNGSSSSSSSTGVASKSGTLSGKVKVAAAPNGGTSVANGGGGVDVDAAGGAGAGTSKGEGGTVRLDSGNRGRSEGSKTLTTSAFAESRAAPAGSSTEEGREGGEGEEVSSSRVDKMKVPMAAGAVSVEGGARTLSDDQDRNGGLG